MEMDSDNESEPAVAREPTVREVIRTGVKGPLDKMPPRDDRLAMLNDAPADYIYILSTLYVPNPEGKMLHDDEMEAFTEAVLKLPMLPNPQEVNVYPQTDDYKNYSGRMSNWYDSKGRKGRSAVPRNTNTDTGTHPCPFCPNKSKNQQRLSRHIETHYDTGVYVCQACHVCFSHEVNMINHWKSSCVVSTHHTDVERQDAKMRNIRKNVQCFLISKSQSKLFHVFGGVMFVPAKHFLEDPIYVTMPQHQSMCHLCFLHVPTKFVECHADVHRGRFRIDGMIFGDYFCHICCRVFKHRDNLFLHWRTTCEEVVAHTPLDLSLDDEELVALVFLCLQQAVPRQTVIQMMYNSQLVLDKLIDKHASEYSMTGCIDKEYYHFPQEILPMQMYPTYDILLDAIPIRKRSEYEDIISKTHSCNLMAMLCPDFYATGMSFNLITLPHARSDSKILYKVVLRYTIEGSVIKTYKISGRTFPQLQAKKANFNTDSQFEEPCKNCISKEKSPVFANRDRMVAHDEKHKENTMNGCLTEKHYCPLCHLLIFVRSHLEHWHHDCHCLKQVLQPEDFQYIDPQLIHNISRHFNAQGIKVRLNFEKQKISAPVEGFTQQKIPKNARFSFTDGNQPLITLRDKVEVSMTATDEILEKVRLAIRRDVEDAKKRYDRVQEKLETQKNLEKLEKPPVHQKLICPHCGGKYLRDTIKYHLVKRHGYTDNDLLRDALESWSDNPGCNVIGLFTQLITEIGKLETSSNKVISGLMSEEEYATIVDYISDPTRNSQELIGDWATQQTEREIKIDGPMALIKTPPSYLAINNLFDVDGLPPGMAAIRPKTTELVASQQVRVLIGPPKLKDRKREAFSLKKPIEEEEAFQQKQVIVWLKADPSVKLKKVIYKDPMTGKLLKDLLRKGIIRIDRNFIEPFRKEAATNGLQIDSVCAFYAAAPPPEDPLFKVREQVLFADGAECDEKAEKGLEDDDRTSPVLSETEHDYFDWRVDDDRSERDESVLAEEEEEDDGDEKANAEEAEERRKRDKDEMQRRRKCKAMVAQNVADRAAGKHIPPKNWPKRTQFKAIRDVLGPCRDPQIEHLPSVSTKKPTRESMAVYSLRDEMILPLYPDVENVKCEYLNNAIYFHQLYTESMPSRNRTGPRIVTTMNANDKAKCFTLKELKRLCDPKLSVQDNFGNVYVGAFVFKDFEGVMEGHLGRIYLRYHIEAQTLKIFKSCDKAGRFKFAWPVDCDSGIWEKEKDLKFTRCMRSKYKPTPVVAQKQTEPSSEDFEPVKKQAKFSVQSTPLQEKPKSQEGNILRAMLESPVTMSRDSMDTDQLHLSKKREPIDLEDFDSENEGDDSDDSDSDEEMTDVETVVDEGENDEEMPLENSVPPQRFEEDMDIA